MTYQTSLHPQSVAADVEAIHAGTALYTNPPEIEQLLDLLDWPACGGRLLDPGCGDGNMVVAALARLELRPGDSLQACRVRGFEFHKPSVIEAQARCRKLLIERGWDPWEAMRTSYTIIQQRDFLLDPPEQKWETILANPPYWRKFRLPDAYRSQFDQTVPPYAQADLLHAYLDRMMAVVTDDGRMGLITSDRWLTNAGAASIRERIGERFCVSHAERLASESPFHRPKDRRQGSPPRVHAVSLILGEKGRRMEKKPFLIEELPSISGVAFTDLVDIRLAPWLGPDGIFIVEDPAILPEADLVPCIMPKGIDPVTDAVLPTSRWAIVTGDKKPHHTVMKHLSANMDRMPERGIRPVAWHPPERFDKHLPLHQEAVLIPRIAKRLRPITIPAGHLPINHSLVVASGLPASLIKSMLEHPQVQKQADILAPRVESGYRSYTATLLRQLVIPYEAIPSDISEAA